MSFCIVFQLMSQGSGGAIDEQISLDIHALGDLQKLNLPATDDSAKYNYSADDKGHYS